MANKPLVVPFTTSEIAAATSAIFSDGGVVASKIEAITPVPFKISAAKHVLNVIASEIWRVRDEIVNITFVPKHMYDGTPVADFPKEGTHAYENAWEDKDSGEREEALHELLLEEALLYRLAEHYADVARDEEDEAGETKQEGGRYDHLRPDGTKVNSFGYDYIRSFDEAMVDMLGFCKKRQTRRIAQIEMIQSGIYTHPYPDLQNAMEYGKTLTSSDRLERIGTKKWFKLVEAAIKYQAACERWEAYKAKEGNEDEREAYDLSKWIYTKAVERFYDAWDLVLHVGTPAWLIDTPEWRTERAKVTTRKVNAQTAEVTAKVAETMSQVAIAEATMNLMKANEASKKAGLLLKQQMAAMEAMAADMQQSGALDALKALAGVATH